MGVWSGEEAPGGHLSRCKVATYCVAREEKGQLPLVHPVPLCGPCLMWPLPTLPRFRVLCQTIIAHKLFDYVVLAFIFLNCITIALERPQIEAGSTVSSWHVWAGQGTGRVAGDYGLL